MLYAHYFKGAIYKIDSPQVVAIVCHLYTKTNLRISHTSLTPQKKGVVLYPTPPPVLQQLCSMAAPCRIERNFRLWLTKNPPAIELCDVKRSRIGLR